MVAVLAAAFLAIFFVGPALALLPPPVVMAAPSNLTAVAASGTAIDLSWSDNTINETGYSIERKSGSSDFVAIVTVTASTTTYTDSGLTPGTTYTYRVKGVGNGGSIKDSQFSNEASATTKSLAIPPVILKAPSNLTAVATSSSVINLAWTDNTTNETAYSIERKSGSSGFAAVATVAASSTTYSDTGLESGTTYTYRVQAIGNESYIHDSQYSNEASAITPTAVVTPPSVSTKTVLRFFIGSTDYYVGSQVQSMDAAPVIYEGRTLLPIRYVATPLGAGVDWNPAENKVVVSLNGKTIELWIGQNTARVNGTLVYIDPDNASVTPIIVPPGRTMLPLRFIAENLGCQVDWIPSNQEVQVTHPK